MPTLVLDPDLIDLLWKIAAGVACTVPCALLGCYLVLRRLSLMGDAISHSVLPGIVLAVFLTGQITSWGIVLGAMAFGVLTAFLTQAVHSLTKVPEDASMGVVFTGLFALGVLLIAQLYHNAHLDDCMLQGVLDSIPFDTTRIFGFAVPRPLPVMLATLLLTLLFVTLLWKELKIVSFDPELASAMGVNATVVHYLLMAVVAGVTVTAFQAVGSVLVVAMLIVPAASAHMLSDRLPVMMLWAAAVAVASTVLGVILAGPALLNTNTAGMMTVVAGAIFGLTVFLAPRHGIAARLLRNARLGIRIVAEDILATLYRRDEAGARGDTEAFGRLQAEASAAAGGVKGRLALRRLYRQAHLEAGPDRQMALTPAGRRRAEALVRSHRLWESYLDRHFELPADHLHDPAERMEHYIGPELQKSIAAELHQPERDPHGKSIPPAAGDS
jgi:ABC-type Mn2+/Zn2+ transport system permease subunit